MSKPSRIRCHDELLCDRCKADQTFLRAARKPASARGPSITVVDLFAGCGGMTVGLEEAARRANCRLSVSAAVDFDPNALAIYKRNFPNANVHVEDVAAIFSGNIGAPLTAREQKVAEEFGRPDLLIGGPPCQGHSDLNNHTRRNDPKNALYLRMARAAEVLAPTVIVIENVATVEMDKGEIVEATSKALEASGYTVKGQILDLRRVGVPQRRRRFVLIASKCLEISPGDVLKVVANAMPNHRDRTLRWAIRDLMSIRSDSTYDTASSPSVKNAERIELLFKKKLYDLPNEFRPECHRDGNHSYVSMYGRLRWTRPAQTITTGFGSMGQGRYVHPQRRRTLTPHEAARLQTFPDWFTFGRDTKRGVLANVIGNAVPPLLMIQLGALIIPALVAAEETVSARKRA